MPSQPTSNPFSPAGRVAVLAIVLALVGATGIVSFIVSSRVETTLLALPVAIGLLTRREFWRIAALVYAVLQAAVSFGFVAILLRIAVSRPASPSTSPYIAWHLTLISIASATFIIVFAFRVLRQPEVKVLFRPFRAAPGA
ncbi:hypothetical protein PLCT1_01106 [Planctomycetaceae bacterium]|nr:hypothetical protein PLCT1_01106 [Planctomycetaceae bacterium]